MYNLTRGGAACQRSEILQALALTGAGDFIGKFADGLDHMILEGGLGLSGGQRQSLLLSRLMIRQPHIVLLDEPTVLDEATERQLIHNLDRWAAHRTLIIATHRMSVLSLVNRVIVVDNGQIIVDDSKANAIARLSKPKGKTQ